jgi:uncharacterized DUF497 family protein
MDLDLIDAPFDLQHIKPRELEEALEDPFAVRFLPDLSEGAREARYFALGRTVGDRYLFLCFRTDGKTIRVICARDMSDGEQRFYDRKYQQLK